VKRQGYAANSVRRLCFDDEINGIVRQMQDPLRKKMRKLIDHYHGSA
jgi:hypothetical protein